MADIALGVLIFAPLVITYFLKSNAALSFLVLCASYVLNVSVIGDLKHLLSETNLSLTNETIGLFLIFLPLVITLLLSRRSTSHDLMLFWQLIAALALGGLLALSVGPLLATSGQLDVTSSKFWNGLNNVQAWVIGGGAALSLVLTWIGGIKHAKKHSH